MMLVHCSSNRKRGRDGGKRLTAVRTGLSALSWNLHHGLLSRRRVTASALRASVIPSEYRSLSTVGAPITNFATVWPILDTSDLNPWFD